MQRHSITSRIPFDPLFLGPEILVSLPWSHRLSLLNSLFVIVGLNFGVLIAWVVVSCITLPLLQLYVRQKEEVAQNEAVAARRRAQVQEKRSPVVR